MDEQNPGVGATTAPERRTAEIRAEIAQTREDMSDTVNAIQDRLKPSSIAAASTERLKQAASDKARELADSEPVAYAAANPVPMAMVGIGLIGLGWLAIAGRDQHSSARDYRRYRQASRSDWRSASGYRRATSEYGQRTIEDSDYEELRARRSPVGTFEDERDRDTAAWGAARYSRQRDNRGLRTYLQRTWSETPLVIGVASAVAGALVAVGLPETESENRLMGDTRDSMVDAAQETVREKVEQVQHAATTAVSNLQDTAKSVVGLGSEDA
jgi:hypothetical protein